MKSKFIAAALALSSFAMFGSPAVAQEDAYEQGRAALEVENDVEDAILIRLGAEQGNAYAQFQFGSMYKNGEGVPKNDAEAVKWFRLAAEQGHAEAQYKLGMAYAYGLGVPENAADAEKWIRLAAEQGNAMAQYELQQQLEFQKMTPKQ